MKTLLVNEYETPIHYHKLSKYVIPNDNHRCELTFEMYGHYQDFVHNIRDRWLSRVTLTDHNKHKYGFNIQEYVFDEQYTQVVFTVAKDVGLLLSDEGVLGEMTYTVDPYEESIRIFTSLHESIDPLLISTITDPSFGIKYHVHFNDYMDNDDNALVFLIMGSGPHSNDRQGGKYNAI